MGNPEQETGQREGPLRRDAAKRTFGNLSPRNPNNESEIPSQNRLVKSAPRESPPRVESDGLDLFGRNPATRAHKSAFHRPSPVSGIARSSVAERAAGAHAHGGR